MIYTSRSQHISGLECPRRAWHAYHAPNGNGLVLGWERKVLNPALFTGICVHAGVTALLGASTIEEALAWALKRFDEETSKRGLDGDAPECRALIEGMILAWHRVRLPRWLEEYEVLAVEREERAVLTEDVILLARADAGVKRKSDGSLFVVNFKTTSYGDQRWQVSFEYDMQLATETLAVEQRMGERVAGVIVEGLLKGEKRKDKDAEGNVIAERQNSPLIYGYKFPGNPPLEPAAYDWQYTRKKGWERFKVWEEAFDPVYSTGMSPVAYWVNWLPEEAVEAQFITLPPIMRSPQQITAKAGQIAAFERRAHEAAEACRRDPSKLDELFPQNEHSCVWPSRCPFVDMCWVSNVSDDPAGSGLYQPRVSNHPVPEEV